MTAELPPFFSFFKYKTNDLLSSIHSKNQYNLISSIFTLVFSVYGSYYSYIFQCVALWGVAVCWWFARYWPWFLFYFIVILQLKSFVPPPPPLPFNRDMYSVYHVFI